MQGFFESCFLVWRFENLLLRYLQLFFISDYYYCYFYNYYCYFFGFQGEDIIYFLFIFFEVWDGFFFKIIKNCYKINWIVELYVYLFYINYELIVIIL